MSQMHTEPHHSTPIFGSCCTHSTEGNPRPTGNAPAQLEKAGILESLLSFVLCDVYWTELWAPVENASRTTLVWLGVCHPSGARTLEGGSA